MGKQLNLKADIYDFTRRVQMKEIFHEIEYNDESLVYNKSHRQFKTKDLELSNLVKEIELLEPQYNTSFQQNLSKEERNALSNLRMNTDIILKPPDKGGGWVIMDKSFYENQLVLNGRLNSCVYKEIESNSDQIVFRKMKDLVHKFKSNLTKKEINYLTNFQFNSSQFYSLPKIHKSKIIQIAVKNSNSDYVEIFQPNDLSGRPIVAGPECPTQRLSCLLEKLLKPLVPCLTTYIKDDWDLLRFLPSQIDFDCNLYTCDIVSLYTSIPIELGLEAIEYWITKKRDLIPPRFSN